MSSTLAPSDRSAYAVGTFFAGAGVMHFARPDFFEAIVPRWFPSPKFANQASGAAEIVLGLGMTETGAVPVFIKIRQGPDLQQGQDPDVYPQGQGPDV